MHHLAQSIRPHASPRGTPRGTALPGGVPFSSPQHLLRLLTCLTAAILLTGCTTGPSGRLVIAGGATDEENGTVWGAFAEGTRDMPIGIVGAATSVPDQSVGSARKAMILHGIASERISELPLRSGNTAGADSPETVKLIENLGGVWFVGGDQKRITATLINNGEDRPALAEIRRLVTLRGGVVGGTSAGAAMMSQQMLTGGDSDKWLTALLGNVPRPSRTAAATPPEPPVDPASILDQGLGFVETFVTDQHFFARGRYGRLAVALIVGEKKFGIGIEENSAIAVELGTGHIRPLGDRAAVVMDASRVTVDRTKGTISGIRLSILGHDDLAIASKGGIILASVPGAATRDTLLRSDPATESLPTVTGSKPFAKGLLPDAMLAAAWSRTGSITLSDDRWTVTFLADDRTTIVGTGPTARARDIELRISRR
jgi:cyanophycinase